MQLNQNIAENGKALRRIAALLCALADLAERAASRSRSVCFLLLWLMRPAETVAQDYLHSLAPGAAWLPESRRLGDGAAEALRLAHRFRLLAAALAALAEDGLAPWRAAPANRPSAGPVAAPAMRPAWAAAIGRLDSS